LTPPPKNIRKTNIKIASDRDWLLRRVFSPSFCVLPWASEALNPKSIAETVCAQSCHKT
jgi:hypothetical protein